MALFDPFLAERYPLAEAVVEISSGIFRGFLSNSFYVKILKLVWRFTREPFKSYFNLAYQTFWMFLGHSTS